MTKKKESAAHDEGKRRGLKAVKPANQGSLEDIAKSAPVVPLPNAVTPQALYQVQAQAELAVQGVGDVSANVIVLVEMLAEAGLVNKSDFVRKVAELKTLVHEDSKKQREELAKEAAKAFEK